MNHYELFSHDADMGIRGVGDTPSEAFEMAALALTSIVVDPKLVPTTQTLTLTIDENSLDFLFFEWINQLIYLMDIHKMVFGSTKVKIEQYHLQATLQGEKINALKAPLGVEIKGATFTELKVMLHQEQYIAQCVVDV